MTRRPYEDVMMAELSKLLRQELAAGLATVFTDLRAAPRAAETAPSPALNIVIQNNVQAQVTARETQDAFGVKQLEITIDQMVARALTGGRETSGVLRALFGLAPGLIGR